MAELTADRLRELVSYDPRSGLFTCRVARKNRLAGDVETKMAGPGYVAFCLDGKQYMAHRLVWLYVHGRWPKQEIDHINGDKADNRLANLREASRAQNAANIPMRAKNISGFKGVVPNKNKWSAQIKLYGTTHHLGTFETPELAHAAYVHAGRLVHGQFSRAD